MRLALTGRQLDVTPSLRQLVTRRLAKLERLLNDHALSAQVVLSLEKRHHNCEITVHARGDHLLTGKGSAASWPQSLSEAVEKILQQALKVKEKWITRKRRGSGAKVIVDGRTAVVPRPTTAAPEKSAIAAAAPRSAAGPSIRATRYAVKPMSVEDAALRIDEVREPFVVFRHAETERINILFQRPDGRLGLIDPEG
jgi:ribosome hibernation promoting factor